MDLLVCEAPLDNSFQKDKLELVNKGSLGRRRKPSRANLKQLLSPGNRFSLQTYSIECPSEDAPSSNHFVEKKCVTNHLNGDIEEESISINRATGSTSVAERTFPRNGFSENFTDYVNTETKVVESTVVEKILTTKKNGENKIQSKYSAERAALALHIAQKASSINRALGKCSTPNHITGKNLVTIKTNNKSEKTNHITENSSVTNHILEKSSSVKLVAENTFVAKNTKQKPFSADLFQENTVHFGVKQPEKLASIPSSKTLVPNGVCGKVCAAPNRISNQKYEISRTPTPIESSINCVKPNVNGHVLKEREKPKLQIKFEPGRKSPSQGSEGRSAVLIQTWERRSRSDSLPKRTRRNKENAMPPTGAARVRDSCSDEAILYRITENGTRIKPSQMKGKEVNMNGPEPEWISLSRKLCAKYVEGNVEPLSQEEQEQTTPSANQPQTPHHPQHNPYETQVKIQEPQIQQQQQQQTHQTNPPNRHHHHLKEEKKIHPEADVPASPDEEPPWIHLSRKLCTKFIEEHIEFPVVVKEESKKEAILVEPNGDVRIIEKIGQPKGRKSKVKKESEPEWVSLSRKLRAKFIESHIDDPDTISLENQLNASDPEETSSDSLPDASTENVRQKPNHESQNKSYFKGHEAKHTKPSAYSTPYQNRFRQNSQNTLQFPEEECSWEYQQMEFDQESDTFQEGESNEETPWEESSPKTEPTEGKPDMFSIDSLEAQSCSNVRPPAYSENPQFISNVECYNNDVSFAPFTVVSEKPHEVKSGCEKKEITVQFISHNGCKKAQKESKSVPKCVDRKTVEKSDNSSFFNLTTWEEAHFESDSEHKLSPRKPKKCDDFRSKSMENVRDPFQSDSGISSKSVKEKIVNDFSVSKSSKSEEYLDKVDEKVLPDKNIINEFQNSFSNLTKSSNGNCSDVSTQSVEQDETSSQYKEKKSECSKTSQTDLHLLCNGFSGSLSNGHFDPDSIVFNGLESLKPKTVPSQCCKTSQTDLNLICCEHLSSDDSVSLLNGDAVKRGNKLKNVKDRDISEKRIRKSSSSSSESNSEGHKSFKSNGGNKINQSKSNNIVFEEECRENGDVRYHESQNHSSKKDHFQSDEETNGINGNSNRPGKTEHSNREQNLNQINNGLSGMKKHFKCNGAIPNGSNSKSSKKEISPKKEFKVTQVSQSNKKSSKTENKTKQSSPVTNEYANIQSSMAKEVTNSERGIGLKPNSIYQEVSDKRRDLDSNSQSTVNLHQQGNSETENFRIGNGVNKGASLVKIKSKSLHDLSRELRGSQSSDDDSSLPKENGSKLSPVKFQEFEFPSDIPLCAKLVSKQQSGKKTSTSSISSSYKRDASPGSETSHVYEDMFKETTSCPSDSEASSWTVMKNNSYYVNGRSSSMNDLDCSDSCSMSVKCDYASSGSEQSTLRSRRSSCASSSFYVNLRDYDQHMLEPGLAKKKNHQKVNAKINSNPPTPESLRHLFTSPLSSMHSPASRLLNRIPNEAESHYYSTATAASSAFKHGFDPVPPKPKKTERSSSVKIKDIAHGIILTFRRFQNHSKSSSHVSPTHYVDVSHLAESGKSGKAKKEGSKKKEDKGRWAFPSENGRTDSDSGCPPSDTHNNSKPRRSSSDLSPRKSNGESSIGDGSASEKKKAKSGKKSSNNKGKKGRSKSSEPRVVPTVTRKVQQMEDGTLYLVTTVSGDTALPGVYSDSPDTSSELSTHRPVKMTGESNC